MGKHRPILNTEEFQIIYVNYLPSKKRSINSLLVKCGLCIETFFQKMQHRKGERK